MTLLNGLLAVDPDRRPAASEITSSAWLAARGVIIASDGLLPGAALSPCPCNVNIDATPPRQPCSPLQTPLARPRTSICKKRGRWGELPPPKRPERLQQVRHRLPELGLRPHHCSLWF